MVRVWRKAGGELKPECIVPTVKHGGGNIMVWVCFSANGVGNLVFIDRIMLKEDYLRIIQNNLKQSAQKMGMIAPFIFQRDNDPKHNATIVSNWFAENNIEVMPWVG